MFSQTFAARPVEWRQLVMTNAAGVSGLKAPAAKCSAISASILTIRGFFNSNGFLNATFANTDFIGPAVVVSQAGSSAFSDYEMRARLGATDDDGIGVLLRVQDDNNFYRITFKNQPPALVVRRGECPWQKVRNGVWSELYRDDAAPLFVTLRAPPRRLRKRSADCSIFRLLSWATRSRLT